MKAGDRESLAVAVAVACCGTAIAYAAFQVLQSVFYPSPDPRTVTHVARIAFFWRAQLAVYAGVMVAIGAYALRRRDPAGFDRLLPPLAVATGAIVIAQSIFVP